MNYLGLPSISGMEMKNVFLRQVSAAGNAQDVTMGFYGFNMDSNAGGMNAQSFYPMDFRKK